jgi:Ketopantoate reductase
VTFFEKAQIPYTVDGDIIHRMWGKYMLNVGLNQVCMLYEATYGEVLSKAETFDIMCKAMREVMALAKAEGVNLTEQDLNYYLDLMRTLVPDATPSMRQDGILKRYSEVEMFAGTIIELGAKHNILVPVNQMLYKKVKEKEAAY